MLKRTITIMSLVFFLNLAFAPIAIASSINIKKDSKFVKKLKSNIESQGIGVTSKIQLKLKDGTKLNGYISEIKDEGITVVNEVDSKSIPVSYPQIKQAKGNNWSAKEWIGIGIAAGVFVILLVALSQDKS